MSTAPDLELLVQARADVHKVHGGGPNRACFGDTHGSGCARATAKRYRELEAEAAAKSGHISAGPANDWRQELIGSARFFGPMHPDIIRGLETAMWEAQQKRPQDVGPRENTLLGCVEVLACLGNNTAVMALNRYWRDIRDTELKSTCGHTSERSYSKSTQSPGGELIWSTLCSDCQTWLPEPALDDIKKTAKKKRK